jgi:hypothetical protein
MNTQAPIPGEVSVLRVMPYEHPAKGKIPAGWTAFPGALSVQIDDGHVPSNDMGFKWLGRLWQEIRPVAPVFRPFRSCHRVFGRLATIPSSTSEHEAKGCSSWQSVQRLPLHHLPFYIAPQPTFVPLLQTSPAVSHLRSNTRHRHLCISTSSQILRVTKAPLPFSARCRPAVSSITASIRQHSQTYKRSSLPRRHELLSSQRTPRRFLSIFKSGVPTGDEHPPQLP